MWQKKMKCKKLQLFMFGIVLVITAGLFNMCLCFTQELSSFSKRGINVDNCPDVYLLTTGTQKIDDYFSSTKEMEQLKSVGTLKGKTVSVPINCKGNDISMYYDMLLEGKDYKKWNYMELVSGDIIAESPKEGEVWISETLAVPNDIKIGDIITLQYNDPISLSVTAIYRTSCFPKAVGFSPMLGSEVDIDKLIEEQNSAFFAINLINYSEKLADDMFLESEDCTSLRTREDVQENLVEFSSMFGSIGIIAAFVIFAVALAILRFIIKNNLLKEFRTIGIYKSLGYNSKQIERFYIIGYLLIGSAAISLGAILSLIIVRKIGLMVTEYVSGFGLSQTSFIMTAISIVLLLLLLYVNLKVGLRRVKKISPVEAITVGVIQADKKLGPSLIKSAKNPFEMAVNHIVKYRRASCMTLIVLFVSMYLSMLFVMIWYSSCKMTENSNLWFCLPKNDAYITGNISDELMDYLNDDCKYSTSAVKGDFSYKKEATVVDYPEIQSTIRYDAYNNFSESVTGIKISEGLPPKENNEIVAGKGLLSKTGLKVGDTIRISINDTIIKYNIVGAYNTVADNSMKFMLTTSALEKSIPEYKSTRAYVRLRNSEDFEEFKEDIESRFTGIVADTKWFALENSVESIRQMLETISIVLVVVFIMFSMVNIIIVAMMDNKKQYRNFGIIKSLGFTTNYIIKQNLSKYLIISVVGAVVSFILQMSLSKKLVGILLVDAFVNPIAWLLVLLVGFILSILGATLIISLSIKKITPVELMEE